MSCGDHTADTTGNQKRQVMRILFINPRHENVIEVPAANSTWREHDFAPPLGLMALSSYIKMFGYDTVKLINLQVPDAITDDEVLKEISDFRPAIIGLTTLTFLYYSVISLINKIKRHFPDTKIVLGGPHTTLYAREAVGRPEVDYAVVGEGEETFLGLLRAIESGQGMGDVAGLVWKTANQTVVTNADRRLTGSLDDLPLPDFSVFDLKQHRVPYDYLHPTGIIISSRGCPFRCSFCSLNYPHYRMRSAASLLKEMHAYKDMGYKAVTFNDDNFNVSRKRFMEICSLIVDAGLELPWSFRGRVDCFDEEMARAAAKAGCIRAHFGVEAGNPQILKETNKGITVRQVETAFALCRKYNIATVAFFIIGHPGETISQAEETIALALRLDPDFVVFTSLMPQPGSEIYEMALRAGAFEDYWREFARNPVPEFRIRTWETGMTEKQIAGLMVSALRRFYFRPSYILRRLASIRGPEDLRSKSGMGLKLAWRLGQSWFRNL